MKKSIALPLALLLSLCLLAGCTVGVGLTAITRQPGNYLYQLDEPIEVIDIETGETLGILVVTGLEILREEPFEALEEDGEDEEGETIYIAVTYNQIVQIFYTWSGPKAVSGSNFSVWDSTGALGRRPEGLEPAPEYEPVAKRDQHSFAAALKNPGSTLDIHFNYNVLQFRPTARIRLEPIA